MQGIAGDHGNSATEWGGARGAGPSARPLGGDCATLSASEELQLPPGSAEWPAVLAGVQTEEGLGQCAQVERDLCLREEEWRVCFD